MTTERRATNWGREVILPSLVVIVGGVLMTAIVKFANLPSKFAVMESRQDGLERVVSKMDDKLDKILLRLPRR